MNEDEKVTNLFFYGRQAYSELRDEDGRKLHDNVRKIRLHKFRHFQHMPLHVDIFPKEQISRELHQRLS